LIKHRGLFSSKIQQAKALELLRVPKCQPGRVSDRGLALVRQRPDAQILTPAARLLHRAMDTTIGTLIRLSEITTLGQLLHHQNDEGL